MTIKEAQHHVDSWIKKFGNGYFQPVTNIGILAEEVGELAHIVLRRYGEQRPKEGDKIDDESISSELADVLWVTIALANQMNIDLTKAFEKTIEKKTVRDSRRFQS